MDSSDHENMNFSDIPSYAEDMNSSGPEASGSSHPGVLAEDSSANSTASSVTEYIRFSGPARRQNWSLPDTIVFYIAKNPSTSKIYSKLIRTCKYFFLVNPIIICSDLELRHPKMDEYSDDDSEEEDSSNNEETNHEGAAVKVTDDYWEITQLSIKNGFYKKLNKKIDLMNYSAKMWIVEFDDSGKSNFWMHDSVTNKNIVSSIIRKIYRCNIKNLKLCSQTISFTEFSFLGASALKIRLDEVTVKYDDSNVVPVEEIVECAKKATDFHIEFDDNDASISSETVKNILQVPHFSKIKFFTLENIPDSFDIETLFVYLKKNKSAQFDLTFSNAISAGYKKRLEKIIDEIIVAGGRRYKTPLIDFHGIDEEKVQKIYMLYCGLSIS